MRVKNCLSMKVGPPSRGHLQGLACPSSSCRRVSFHLTVTTTFLHNAQHQGMLKISEKRPYASNKTKNQQYPVTPRNGKAQNHLFRNTADWSASCALLLSRYHGHVHLLMQIGNYLGALQNWVRMQRDADPQDKLIFSIVGWHALTLPQNPGSLLDARNDMLATLLAIGLDPEKSIIFHQDQVYISSLMYST